MRIGEVAKLTGTTERQLRYYEDQGLITCRRTSNGYRIYDRTAIRRIRQIRDLIDSGVPTRVIKDILPCLHGATGVPSHCAVDELSAQLRRHHQKMSEHIERLTRNRDAIAAYIEALTKQASASSPSPV